MAALRFCTRSLLSASISSSRTCTRQAKHTASKAHGKKPPLGQLVHKEHRPSAAHNPRHSLDNFRRGDHDRATRAASDCTLICACAVA
jgi:hypothetical protein